MSAALEIHERFKRKMAKGGEIDQILNGGDQLAKIPPAMDDEISLIRKQIDIQMQEYGAALVAAVAWFRGWKERRRITHFRCDDRSTRH